MNRQEIEQKIIHFLHTNYTPQEYADFSKEMQDLGAGALFTQIEWSFSQDCLRRQQMC